MHRMHTASIAKDSTNPKADSSRINTARGAAQTQEITRLRSCEPKFRPILPLPTTRQNAASIAKVPIILKSEKRSDEVKVRYGGGVCRIVRGSEFPDLSYQCPWWPEGKRRWIMQETVPWAKTRAE